MTDKEIVDKALVFAKKNGFAIYVLIALCFGYTFGKDLAIKHNAQDAAVRQAAPLTESP